VNVDTLIGQLRSINDPGDWNDDGVYDAVGQALAYAAGWDGITLMRVLSYALTDANFHQAAARVDQIVTDEIGEDDSDQITT
jgi:hypothetical protein